MLDAHPKSLGNPPTDMKRFVNHTAPSNKQILTTRWIKARSERVAGCREEPRKAAPQPMGTKRPNVNAPSSIAPLQGCPLEAAPTTTCSNNGVHDGQMVEPKVAPGANAPTDPAIGRRGPTRSRRDGRQRARSRYREIRGPMRPPRTRVEDDW